MKKIILLTSILSISGFVMHSYLQEDNKLNSELIQKIETKKKKKKGRIKDLIGGQENPFSRRALLKNETQLKLENPETGEIPKNIRQKEKEFVAQLPIALQEVEFNQRGYFDIGGRTRAFAVDRMDENNLLAGGVSGGIFRSTDEGASWEKITPSDDFHNITCIVQDRRPGKENVWYYGTGEGYGNSASASGAYYFGNGMYKSTDNGLTWEPLSSTVSNTPNSFDKNWDIMWNVEVDPSIDTLDIVYGACYGVIYKSIDGGISWSPTLGAESSSAYTTNIKVASNGNTYGFVNSDAPGNMRGVWFGKHGQSWKKIIPSNFPTTYERAVIDINPQNENEVYFFMQTPNSGKHTNTFFDGEDWNSLWKFTYDPLDTTSTNGVWEDLSENLPASGTSFATLYTQNAYDMTIRVHPDSSNIIYIGGTNLYRSTDGFTSDSNTTMIGGYNPTSIDTDWSIWENHHPDQHGIVFSPVSKKLYSANDGGVFRAQDPFAENMVWDPLNYGYFSTQLYAISMNKKQATNTLAAGFQDNGNFVTRSSNITDVWTMAYNGDGGFSYITENEEDIYLSIQRGKVGKFTLDSDGNAQSFRRIDPANRNHDEGGLFIHPFVVDPVSENIMYYPLKDTLYRLKNLSSITENGSQDPLNTGWEKIINIPISANKKITSIHATTSNPSNVVYLGTDARDVFKVEDAHSATPIVTKLAYKDTNNSSAYTTAYTIDITSNPEDGNEVMLVQSNYITKSLAYTKDGGDTWEKAGGNLEENIDGSGNGPSLRCALIAPLADGNKLYLVGSSSGLFATYNMHADNTVWKRVSPNKIGNVVIERLEYRKLDGLLLIATHGNGLYYAHVDELSDILDVDDRENVAQEEQLVINMNPISSNQLDFTWNGEQGQTEVQIFDNLGRKVRSDIVNLGRRNVLDVSLSNGVYHLVIRGEKKLSQQSFVVK
jgi:photosystem II stability/assembly factor-like uncharacterized protein